VISVQLTELLPNSRLKATTIIGTENGLNPWLGRQAVRRVRDFEPGSWVSQPEGMQGSSLFCLTWRFLPLGSNRWICFALSVQALVLLSSRTVTPLQSNLFFLLYGATSQYTSLPLLQPGSHMARFLIRSPSIWRRSSLVHIPSLSFPMLVHSGIELECWDYWSYQQPIL